MAGVFTAAWHAGADHIVGNVGARVGGVCCAAIGIADVHRHFEEIFRGVTARGRRAPTRNPHLTAFRHSTALVTTESVDGAGFGGSDSRGQVDEGNIVIKGAAVVAGMHEKLTGTHNLAATAFLVGARADRNTTCCGAIQAMRGSNDPGGRQ